MTLRLSLIVFSLEACPHYHLWLNICRCFSGTPQRSDHCEQASIVETNHVSYAQRYQTKAMALHLNLYLSTSRKGCSYLTGNLRAEVSLCPSSEASYTHPRNRYESGLYKLKPPQLLISKHLAPPQAS
uniref:Uncharacterized protein n=1 Tax=Zea mays TaxID=4577 RepID=C0HG77_MAIZE|nr:unknown [Zea mays]